MAKGAKKKVKSEAQVENQRRHNRSTKGNNSKNRPMIWEHKLVKEGDKFVREDVEYSKDTQWDWTKIYDAATDREGVTRLVRKKREKQAPLPEPYDTLLDNWEEGIRAYALEWGARIQRDQLDDGWFRYTVYQKVEDTTFVLLTVDSPKNIHFGGRNKFRKRRK